MNFLKITKCYVGDIERNVESLSSISDSKKRVLYSLSDGIVGGQGDGPLYPKPLPLGIVMFTNSSYLNDVFVLNIRIFLYFCEQRASLLSEGYRRSCSQLYMQR